MCEISLSNSRLPRAEIRAPSVIPLPTRHRMLSSKQSHDSDPLSARQDVDCTPFSRQRACDSGHDCHLFWKQTLDVLFWHVHPGTPLLCPWKPTNINEIFNSATKIALDVSHASSSKTSHPNGYAVRLSLASKRQYSFVYSLVSSCRLAFARFQCNEHWQRKQYVANASFYQARRSVICQKATTRHR